MRPYSSSAGRGAKKPAQAGKGRVRRVRNPLLISESTLDFNPRFWPPGHVSYSNYMRSAEWFHKRMMVMALAEGVCEVKWCFNLAQDVHHLTYDRLGCERMEDLKAVCRWHHQVLHRREV